jgi:hypothetical protein
MYIKKIRTILILILKMKSRDLLHRKLNCFPEAVKKDRNGYYTLSVEPVYLAMINAIKQLNAETNKLEIENEVRKNRNYILKEKIRSLETRLNRLEE